MTGRCHQCCFARVYLLLHLLSSPSLRRNGPNKSSLKRFERPVGKLLAIASQNCPEPVPISRERLILEHVMKHQRHFDISETVNREAARIRKMIFDLDRIVQLLDCDITTEEERTRISNRSDAAYPILARMLAACRDNLRETIAALEQ